MPNTMIVKQSDVSHGTALHLADNWSYGRNSLCGKPMRDIARDFEISHKRVCGTCAKIMAKRVEKAHDEALRTVTFQAGDTVMYIGVGADTGDLDTVGTVIAVDGATLTIQWADGTIDDEMVAGRLVHFAKTAPAVEAAHAEAIEIHAELVRDEMRAYAVNWNRVVDVEAAHAEAIEIAKDRLDIADFDEEAVYAQADPAQVAAELENELCPPVCGHGKTADEACLGQPCVDNVDNAHLIALTDATEENNKMTTPLYVRITEAVVSQANASTVVKENETFSFGTLGWSGGLPHIDLYRASGERVRFDLEYFKKVAVAVDHVYFQPQPRGLDHPALRRAFVQAGKPEVERLREERDAFKNRLMESFVYMTLAADKIETTSISRTDFAEAMRQFVRDGHVL